MKRFLSFIVVALMATVTCVAQSTEELSKQQKELNEINKKLLQAKPIKDAKKQAKALKKEGWMVSAGEKNLEKQLTESMLLSEELTTDEEGNPTKRFILHTAIATAGTYNAAYATARSNAIVELAGNLRTQVAAAIQGKLDNAQLSSTSAVTVDKFNQRTKAIIDETITNTRPVVAIYRVLDNKNFEVQVRMAFDKKELALRMKRKIMQELEEEGDELLKIVDEVIGTY